MRRLVELDEDGEVGCVIGSAERACHGRTGWHPHRTVKLCAQLRGSAAERVFLSELDARTCCRQPDADASRSGGAERSGSEQCEALTVYDVAEDSASRWLVAAERSEACADRSECHRATAAPAAPLRVTNRRRVRGDRAVAVPLPALSPRRAHTGARRFGAASYAERRRLAAGGSRPLWRSSRSTALASAPVASASSA